ncbi:hypothetical protein PENSTE_c002G04501 [Penicillium steckii]|uniref:Xylanolytic transcriptional activator regulatory domain-containing protein n=1 Tax=Penicillium steckii TaxID=303698 RepID=A0A1V6TTT4_9EURO|nr:hypothetical protein PENSTE_c002G04501 [Penicillium steckii]
MKNMETPTTRQRKPVKTENDSMSIPQRSEDISLEDGNEPLLTKDSTRNLNGEQTSGLSASKPSDGDDKSTTLSSPTANSGWATVKIILGESYTSYLLPFVFLGIIAGRQHWDDSLVFLLNFLAILPLASLLSFATEELAKSVGQLLGGLINATFGNAVEMIVGITAVGRGEMNIVQSSMVGSILSGSLLILGCCLTAGGLSKDTVAFNIDVSGILSSLMVVASASLIIPSILDATTPTKWDTEHNSVLNLSRATSVVLLIFYVVYLYFQLKSHAALFVDDSEPDEEEEAKLGPWSASAVLIMATLGVTSCSDYLVDSVDGFVEAWGVSRAFIGLIVVPVIGNAGEFNTAITAATKDSMDLAIGVIVGSTLQIALFVSPFLVMCGWVIGQPMSLRYSTFETVVFFLSVIVMDCLIRGGRSNYYEGFLLIGTERRRRCEIPVSGASCKYCSDRGLACSNSEPSRGPQINDQLEHFTSQSSLCVATPIFPPQDDQGLCTELVQLYFDYVHDQFHTLFHQPTFMNDLSQHKAPPILVHGMMALSARFSKNPIFSNVDARERGKYYEEQCKRLLDWNDISLTTIQACVLLGAIAITDGKAASENIHYAVACRMAQLLDLPRREARSMVEREVNLRVWWTLCMIDVWSSSGVRLPRLLTPIDSVPLPMDEILFMSLRPVQENDVPVTTDNKSSILAEMVRLNHILLQINQFNIRASENSLDSHSLMADVENLSTQLDVWFEELPAHMQDTRENLTRYSDKGLGRLLVALYLGYYNYGQMLFYRFLHDDSRSPDARTRFYANKCKYHAGRLCEIVYASEEVPGCDAKYNMVGHVLMIASTVQIHSLLFEDDEEIVTTAKRRLEKNFCILTDLVSLWPTLDVCMDRLMTFHASCRNSAETSFCMDQWMVRFLVEFANPVSGKGKETGDKTSWSLSNMGVTTS